MILPLFAIYATKAVHAAQAQAQAARAITQNHAAIQYKTDLPPSADLSYSIQFKQKGIRLEGESRVHWHVNNGKFTLHTESSSKLIGKILDAKTEGFIDNYGLAPLTFTEKRLLKNSVNVTFNRHAKTITFSSSSETYPIKGGEQDRNSALWQLISVARAAPAKFKPDSEWKFFVAGTDDADPWTFKVLKYEKLLTPLGELNTVHLLKLSQSGKQQIDIWLAPALEWYPMKLRYTENTNTDGDYIEQILVNITKKPSS